ALVPKNARKVFEGEIFDMYQWEQELYDGSTAIFEKGSRPDTAVVYPVTDEGKILIIEDSQPHRETVLTSISGRIEDNETPEEAAKRELLEETGYEVRELVSFYTTTPVEKLDWINYVFIAKGCRKTQEPAPDPGEKIVVREVSFDELISLSAEGKLRGKDFQIIALRALLDENNMNELRNKFTTNI
ncbi:NUDIX hydrolase, partial [Patescibacteria group bacterium]